MRSTSNELLKAVRLALYASASAAVGLSSAPVFAQQDAGASRLETIVVTGSRIRRVDIESSNPIVTIDRADIQKSGKVTIGDLIQDLPSIAGNATNPRVNNGGGDGASEVSLRGLGSTRTLLLINGHRAVNNDVNLIPVSAIERIEVLKDGASSVYGSDAIAGVINFVLRSNYQGVDFSAEYGISDADDGEREGYSFSFGQTSDRGSIMAGINYNKYKEVSSGAREYSRLARYFSSGEGYAVGGSGRNPRGRINVVGTPLGDQLGCATVTLIPGASGSSTGDYRCYTSADGYNYQAVNLLLTPQERTGAFIIGNYQVSDNVQAYLEVMYNRTTANFAIAPLPFDARGDDVSISAGNYYNPFGVGFGIPEGRDFLTRFTSLGQRRGYYATTTGQITTGLKGNFGDTSWQWDAGFNYGHIGQINKTRGYIFYEGLREALGPSFFDTATNTVTCGVPGAPISGCTPLNIFNIFDPQSIETLGKYAATPLYETTTMLRSFEANFSGELFDLPAGAASLAVGASYRKETSSYLVDFIAISNDAGNCFISQEACSTPLSGAFDVKEVYGEMLVPLLKDVPFAKALNLTLGVRYSDYKATGANIGDTTNGKIGLEWRPIDDLLLRGTISQVFRAPNINDLYAGASGDAPIVADPCLGYDGNLAHANACQNAIGLSGGGLSQINGVRYGALAAGLPIKPEYGKSYDFGFVYDPKWLDGLSVSVDYWRVKLNDTILNPVDAQTVLNTCYNDNSHVLCQFIHRYDDGQIQFVGQPTTNLGTLDTSGADLGIRYRLPETPIGNFLVTLDSTYLIKYDNDIGSDIPVTHVAGHYNGLYGNFPRWRALAGLNWNLGNFDASWRIRYVGRTSVGSEDPGQADSADGCYRDDVNCEGPWVTSPTRLRYGAYAYHNVSAGYNINQINTRVEVGVDNVSNKQPPIFYQNNVLNANTDVNTYDTVGRYYWARVSVKF
jgi:outer membrane receptor protein involved in Fe transport